VFLLQYETDAVTWLANVAYTRNNYKLAADRAAWRSDLVRLSAAALVKVHEKTRLFADIGAATHGDRFSNALANYFLMGIIYSPKKDIDFNLGRKFAISRPETDRAWTIGATFRF
jgi:hypothetical protein